MKLRIVRIQDGNRITDTIEFPDVNDVARTALGRIVFAGLLDGGTVTVERLSEMGIPAIGEDDPICPDITGADLAVVSLPYGTIVRRGLALRQSELVA